MARFYFEKIDGITIINNNFYSKNTCIDQSTGHISIDHFFASNNVKASGIINAETIETFGNICLIDWTNNNYDVIIKSPIITTPLSLIKQKSYLYKNDTIIASLLYDGNNKIRIDCNSSYIFETIPSIQNCDISFGESNYGLLIVITGQCNEKHYLNITLFDGTFSPLIDIVGDSIEYSDNGFRVSRNLNDMVSRSVVTDYRFEKNKLQYHTTFTQKRNPTKLIPYLFLEAIKAEDYDNASTYLSSDIDASADIFKKYFGSFDTIVCPKYRDYKKASDLDTVALIQYTNDTIIHPAFYTFVVENGLITNIKSGL